MNMYNTIKFMVIAELSTITIVYKKLFSSSYDSLDLLYFWTEQC